MANKYQDAILNAVDYLVNNRVSSLDRDKTITATIVACNNAITQEYKISYNGGYLLAYAQENASYKRDTSVFVLVPEGDFSKKKTIVGLASSSSSDSNVSFVSSLVNDYNKIGENAFSNQRRWGLNSYKKEDYKLIYQHGLSDETFLSVNEANLLLYIAQAEALLLQGTFQTALPRAHRTSSSGKYGVSFTLAFKNGDEQTKKYGADRVAKIGVSDIEFEISDTDFLVTTASGAFLKNHFFPQRKALAQAWSNYQSSGDKTTFQTTAKGIANQLDGFAAQVGLNISSYTDVIRIAEQEYEITSAAQKSTTNILAHYIEYIQNNFSEDSWKENCLTFLNILKTYDDVYTSNSALSTLLDNLISDVTKATSDTYQDLLINQETPAIKYVSYTLDSSNMLGNPMLYTSETTQYNIFQVDSSNFLYIDSVLLFSRNFVEEDDTAVHKDNNIFFSNFMVYGLQKISSTSGDYVLRLGTPSGAVFKTTTSTEKLYVQANLTKLNDDLSDTASFSWFIKDDRINSSSEEYRIAAGSGWRFLQSKGQTKELQLLGSENRAYENKYLCVANYKESLILKSNFIIYNESCQRDISITTNYPLTEFCVDRGIPELTCTIDGNAKDFEKDKTNNKHDDSLFTFCWSVTDNNDNTTTLNQTQEELKLQLEKARKDGVGYSKLMSLQNAITKLEGVTIDKNLLIYPVSLFQDSATFSCSVFLQEDASSESYFIGSAELTLKNNSVADPVDYSIRIENGDQVFQYSESGVTPASERYTDPQEILPLTCHFYDKQGLEVNSNTYTVKWRVPTSDTMITTPSEGMAVNPATMLYEWYMSSPYPTDIADSYDYQALHNQVTCIVTYQGIEYTQDTDFSFLKIGDNGTNGTDVVAKIYPKYTDSGKLFAIEKIGESVTTNVTNHRSLENNPLQFKLYRRNDIIDPTSVNWEIAGKHSKHLEVVEGILSWVKDKTGSNLKNNQIVKASTTYTISGTETDKETAAATSTSQVYNAFCPVPFIEYYNNKAYPISIDRDATIKQVLYNADGRNPMYNKKQGLSLSLGTTEKKTITFSVMGGVNENANTCSLRLFETENGSFAKGETEITKTNEITIGEGEEETTSITDTVSVFVVPADICSGEYSNHIIHAAVKSESGALEAEVYLPVYLSLNTYGLASLNAWDGNHIEINEDGEYILAPQIGAGYKGKDPNDSKRDNVFTGIVMGQAKTYDDNDEKNTTGLLGYSGGKQSIWLDAVTGKAVFGLPSNAGSQDNGYNEGRIKLIPGGNSQIGNWTIGSNAIYSAKQLRADGKWYGVEDDGDNDTTIADQLDVSKNPLKSEYKGKGTNDYSIQDASVAIPHDMQGAILSSFPAYLSIKGKPLNDKNSSIAWGDANTVLEKEDSLEVEIDPNKSSLFSIYRHANKNDGTGEYYRYPLVGINSNGQFYTNAVENGESSMGIGVIGAFNKSAAKGEYVGGQFAYGSKNIFKFFTDAKSSDIETSPLYITTGTTLENEYPRPVKLYGKEFSLYTSGSSSTSTSSDHYFTINNDDIILGHGTGTSANYLSLTSNVSHTNTLELSSSNVSVSLGKTLTSNVAGKITNTFSGGVKNTVSVSGDTSGLAIEDAITGYTKKTVSKYSVATYGSGNLQVDASFGNNGGSPVLLKKTNTGSSTSSRLEFKTTGAINMVSQIGGMTLLSNNSGSEFPLTLGSKGPGAIVQIGAFQEAGTTTDEELSWANNVAAYLRLKSRSDGKTWFNLNSNRGAVYSNPSTGSGDTGLSISIPYITNDTPASAPNVNPNMVVVDPMLYVPGAAVFAGKYSGQTNSFYDCSVFAQRGVLSNRYMLWDNTSSWKEWKTKVSNKSHNNLSGQNGNNVEEILKWLLAEIEAVRNETRNYANNRASEAESNAKEYAKEYTKGYTYSSETIDSKLSGKANTSHTHSQYVTNYTYSNHTHSVSFNGTQWIGDSPLNSYSDGAGNSFYVPNTWSYLSNLTATTSTP